MVFGVLGSSCLLFWGFVLPTSHLNGSPAHPGAAAPSRRGARGTRRREDSTSCPSCGGRAHRGPGRRPESRCRAGAWT